LMSLIYDGHRARLIPAARSREWTRSKELEEKVKGRLRSSTCQGCISTLCPIQFDSSDRSDDYMAKPCQVRSPSHASEERMLKRGDFQTILIKRRGSSLGDRGFLAYRPGPYEGKYRLRSPEKYGVVS
jgi:hypothetical protein